MIFENFIEKTTIEQNRCAMACQGCGAVLLCHSKNKPPAMQGEDRSLDISMNSCAKIKVGLQNHK